MIVDSHAHVYRTAAQGDAHKHAYEIHEYGSGDVVLGPDAGTVDQLVAQMDRASVDRAFVLNLFAVTEADDGTTVWSIPGNDVGDPVPVDVDRARAELIQTNRWFTALANAEPRLVPIVSLDPSLFTPDGLRDHLVECIEWGAKGVKLHALSQGFHSSDPRLHPVYRVLEEADLPVIAHSGTGTGSRERDAVPAAFGDVAATFPKLRLVLAHLGGGAWSEAAPFARAYPSVAFDCCEIISWVGAENAPTPAELTDLIRQIGVERVMLGSDYPWYDLDDTVNRLLDLPGLSEEEQHLILAGNALRLTGAAM